MDIYSIIINDDLVNEIPEIIINYIFNFKYSTDFCKNYKINLLDVEYYLFPNGYNRLNNNDMKNYIKNILKDKSIYYIKEAFNNSNLDYEIILRIVNAINLELYDDQIKVLHDRLALLTTSINDVNDKLNIIIDFMSVTKNDY